MNEWISVDDRLPKCQGSYLVCKTYGDGVGVVMIDMYSRNFYSNGFDWTINDITHWQPLPEPPQEAAK